MVVVVVVTVDCGLLVVIELGLGVVVELVLLGNVVGLESVVGLIVVLIAGVVFVLYDGVLELPVVFGKGVVAFVAGLVEELLLAVIPAHLATCFSWLQVWISSSQAVPSPQVNSCFINPPLSFDWHL